MPLPSSKKRTCSFPPGFPAKALPRNFSPKRRTLPGIFRPGRIHPSLRRASLTAECAVVLPLFFFAVLTLICLMDAAALEASGNLALSNRAREMAAAAGTASAASGAFEGGAAKEGNTGSASALTGAWIRLRSSESVPFPVPLLSRRGIRVRTSARVYPWIGYAPGSDDAGAGQDGMVYLTDYASVYHTFADCTHLDLAIYATTTAQVGRLRNEYGRRYQPCSGFPSGYAGVVYVTKKGDCYYPSLSYAGLTRHVYLVPRSNAGHLAVCERCARREAHACSAA